MIKSKNKNPIRILIVDDSRAARGILKEIFGQVEDMTVIGEAENGKDAVDKAMDLKPDLIIMDISLSLMDGHKAIELIMARQAVPILIVSTQDDAQTGLEAISKGALDIFPKSDITNNEFVKKVRLISTIKVITHLGGGRKIANTVHSSLTKNVTNPVLQGECSHQHGIVAIASSTGGPRALCLLLSTLSSDFPFPIVIAQHIAQGFTDGLIDILGTHSLFPVKKGEHGEQVESGVVYVSPSSRHMFIDRDRRIGFLERRSSDIYFPSCDRLLSSAAKIYGHKSIGIILTGMGKDGVAGIRKIREVGGKTIAQDESTSIVFGMPGEAIASGCVDVVAAIQDIGAELTETDCRGKRIL